MASGASQSLATEDGFTPLAVALQQGHDKVREYTDHLIMSKVREYTDNMIMGKGQGVHGSFDHGQGQGVQ